MFFFFEFVYGVDYIDGFPYIESSLHPWDEAYFMVVNYCFDAFLDSVCQKFVECFCIDVYKGDWTEVLFPCLVFGLGISFVVASKN